MAIWGWSNQGMQADSSFLFEMESFPEKNFSLGFCLQCQSILLQI